MTSDSPPPTGDRQKIGTAGSPDQSSQGGDLPFCGDFDIRIASDGTWFHQGSPIGRKPLVKLFSTILKRDDAGDYWLATPVERGRIVVDDAPFTAVEFDQSGAGRGQVVRLRTNLDDWVELDQEHPIRVALDGETGEPRPYIMVRDGLEALILRSVYYGLADIAVEEPSDGGNRFGLWSKQTFFPLDGSA